MRPPGSRSFLLLLLPKGFRDGGIRRRRATPGDGLAPAHRGLALEQDALLKPDRCGGGGGAHGLDDQAELGAAVELVPLDPDEKVDLARGQLAGAPSHQTAPAQTPRSSATLSLTWRPLYPIARAGPTGAGGGPGGSAPGCRGRTAAGGPIARTPPASAGQRELASTVTRDRAARAAPGPRSRAPRGREGEPAARPEASRRRRRSGCRRGSRAPASAASGVRPAARGRTSSGRTDRHRAAPTQRRQRDRAPVALDQPGRGQADHAGRPVRTDRNRPWRSAGWGPRSAPSRPPRRASAQAAREEPRVLDPAPGPRQYPSVSSMPLAGSAGRRSATGSGLGRILGQRSSPTAARRRRGGRSVQAGTERPAGRVAVADRARPAPGDPDSARDARTAAGVQVGQPGPSQAAVLADERRDVGDRPERDQVEHSLAWRPKAIRSPVAR